MGLSKIPEPSEDDVRKLILAMRGRYTAAKRAGDRAEQQRDRGSVLVMSDEVWWILSGVAYYQYSDRAVAEAERDSGMRFNYDRQFSADEWAALGGEELTKGSIIPIRPLRIERVEVEK